MDNLLKVNAIVIKNMPVGEYDRLVTLLTKENGKISAFARGARRPSSALIAATLPFATGVFSLYPGRSSYTVKSADIKEHFSELLEDLDGITYGSYVMEVADYYTVDNLPDDAMMRLSFLTLKAITKRVVDLKLIRYIFELRAMVCEGEFPGLLPEVINKASLDEDSMRAIEYIKNAPVEKLYRFNLAEDSLRALGRAADIYRKKIWDFTPRSLGVIESMGS